MENDTLSLIKENVIQGRVTADDEGLEEEMVGKPGVKELTEKALQEGISPRQIVDTLTAGMGVVGDKFEAKEYFIPDMLASAEAVGATMELLEPLLLKSGIEPKAKVAMATVKGDLHDIGKNIVSILLRGDGYIVKDLGTDVAPETIVKAVREENVEVIGLSALLTSTMGNMSEVIEALKEEGLRDRVKVFVGGAPVTEEFAKSIGADGYGADAFEAVRVVNGLIKNQRG